VVTLVTRMHLRPSSSVLQVWDSVLSEDTHSNGSTFWEFGTLMGKAGTTGRLGIVLID